jgi:putative hydrolase of HD superfamily
MDFIVEIDKLKKVFRRSQIIDSSRYENDAEHSWHISVMAYTLCGFFNEGFNSLNVHRAVKMLLLHDLVEIHAGDTYCYDTRAQEGKFERESDAADKLFSLLPDEIGAEFKNLWLEFEAEETDDAVFASIMDKLQPFLLNYKNNGIPWLDNLITVAQVYKRMDLIFKKAPAALSACVKTLVEDAAAKGYLVNNEKQDG